jgi:hypothetical protein
MEKKGCGRKRLWTNLRYYPCIRLEGLNETTKNLSQNRLYPRLEPGNSGIQSRNVNHSTTTFGGIHVIIAFVWLWEFEGMPYFLKYLTTLFQLYRFTASVFLWNPCDFCCPVSLRVFFGGDVTAWVLWGYKVLRRDAALWQNKGQSVWSVIFFHMKHARRKKLNKLMYLKQNVYHRTHVMHAYFYKFLFIQSSSQKQVLLWHEGLMTVKIKLFFVVTPCEFVGR